MLQVYLLRPCRRYTMIPASRTFGIDRCRLDTTYWFTYRPTSSRQSSWCRRASNRCVCHARSMSIVGTKKEPLDSAISPRNLWSPSVLWSGQNRQRYVRMIPCYTVPQHDSVFFRISLSIPNRASSARMMLGAIPMQTAISTSHFHAELEGRSNTNCANEVN